MATILEKPLKRQLRIGSDAYVVTLSPDSLKLAVKGRRKGLELSWKDLVTGEAALATALNASLANALVSLRPKRAPSPPTRQRRRARSA
jgi:hypothetical protein